MVICQKITVTVVFWQANKQTNKKMAEKMFRKKSASMPLSLTESYWPDPTCGRNTCSGNSWQETAWILFFCLIAAWVCARAGRPGSLKHLGYWNLLMVVFLPVFFCVLPPIAPNTSPLPQDVFLCNVFGSPSCKMRSRCQCLEYSALAA